MCVREREVCVCERERCVGVSVFCSVCVKEVSFLSPPPMSPVHLLWCYLPVASHSPPVSYQCL